MERSDRGPTLTRQRRPHRLFENVADWMGQVGGRMVSGPGPETDGSNADSGGITDE
ncbi:hypothetical protein [Halalkalicoccus ordinarius]|uniref:hypothetical protein n=1 Tax=Halalkalicoccus ordinarius TaxID=3116651 RepID=UPI00300EF6B7